VFESMVVLYLILLTFLLNLLPSILVVVA
jgi:hypothetical protein